MDGICRIVPVLVLAALCHSNGQSDRCSGPSCVTESGDAASATSSADKVAATLAELQAGQRNLEKQMTSMYQHISSLLIATNSQLAASNAQLSAQSKHLDVVENTFSQRLEDFEKGLSSKMAAIESVQSLLRTEVASVMTKLTDSANKQQASLSGLSSKMVAVETMQGAMKTEVSGSVANLTNSQNKQQRSLDYHTDKLNALSVCACPRNRVVYVRHPANIYQFTFEQAKAACRARGGELATPEHLVEAWKMGLEQCNCGWLSDGSVRFPMHFAKPGCGGYSPGVFKCTMTNADAYCLLP